MTGGIVLEDTWMTDNLRNKGQVIPGEPKVTQTNYQGINALLLPLPRICWEITDTRVRARVQQGDRQGRRQAPRGGCGGGGGDGYDPGGVDDGNKEDKEEDDATSSSSENVREVSPRRLEQWVQRIAGAPGGGRLPDEPDPDYDDHMIG